MLFKDIMMLDENLTPKNHMYIGIKGEKIDYIGTELPKENYGEIYEGKGRLIMSGFFNAHAHSPMTILRGYGENMKLQEWLNEKIFPFEAKLNGERVYWATLLAMAESFRFGIVSSTDMYYFCDDMARAILASGAKNNLSRGIVNFGTEDIRKQDSFREVETLYRDFHLSGDGRLRIDLSIHAEYTSDPATVQSIAAYAKELGAHMHVHLSETKFEHEECKARRGKTPAQYFNALGAFDGKATAAHCVHLEDEDFDILAQRGVTVGTCPASNMKLSSGICNVPLLLQKGVNVAIGTDSVSSNNSLNFIEEMKLMAISAKVRDGNPTAISPKEVLYAATKAGALSQGREDCGALKVGNKADLIVLDIDQPHMHPAHDILTNIVYSASGSDIILTMADGKVLYQDGEYRTIDIEKTVAEAEKATKEIITELR